MKKNLFLSFLIASLVVLNGCWWRKKKNSSELQTTSSTTQSGNKGTPGQQLAFFDNSQDVDSFVLDEEIAQKSGDMTIALNDQASSATLKHPQAHTIYFDYDSDQIRPDQSNALKQMKKDIENWQKEGKKIVFKGHACKWHGTSSYNLALSNERAQHVAHMCKLPTEKCKVFGVGNEEPVVFDNSKNGQAANRRVEVYPTTA